MGTPSRDSWLLVAAVAVVTTFATLSAGTAQAVAQPAVDDETVVLAVEGEGGGEGTGEAPGGEAEQLPGPEPNPTTTFAPDAYERTWTWGLGVILFVVTGVITAAIGLGYYVLVGRDREER